MRSIALAALLAVAGCGTVAPQSNPNAPSAGKQEGEGSTVATVNAPSDSGAPRPTAGQTPTNDVKN